MSKSDVAESLNRIRRYPPPWQQKGTVFDEAAKLTQDAGSTPAASTIYASRCVYDGGVLDSTGKVDTVENGRGRAALNASKLLTANDAEYALAA